MLSYSMIFKQYTTIFFAFFFFFPYALYIRRSSSNDIPPTLTVMHEYMVYITDYDRGEERAGGRSDEGAGGMS